MPTETEIEQICAERSCRQETPQRVPVSATQVYEGIYPRSPYVAGPGALVVLPGESIQVDAKVGADGTLEDLRVVPEGGSLAVSVSGEPGMTLLTVKSEFGRPLHYCAHINIPGHGRVKTSIVGVGAGISGTEMWQDPIIELVLSDFRLTDVQQACR